MKDYGVKFSTLENSEDKREKMTKQQLHLGMIALYAIALAEYYEGNYFGEFYCHMAQMAMLRRPRP